MSVDLPSASADSDKPLCLLMGMSRAGTTSAVRALNLRGDTVAFGETCFWSMKQSRPKSGFLDRQAIDEVADLFATTHLDPVQDGAGSLEPSREELSSAVVAAIKAVEAPARPLTVFRALGAAVAKVTEKTFWAEKTPHHLMHLDYIMQQAPETRVIIMLRTPEAFLNSYKHQGDRKPTAVRQNFHRLYHPALAALVCRGYLKASLNAVKRYPNNVQILKLEDLKSDPQRALNNMFQHFQLSPNSEAYFPVSNSSFVNGISRDELSRAEMTWLRILVGSYARELGFQIPAGRHHIGKLLQSLPALAAWPFVNLQTFLSYKLSPFALAKRWLR